MIDRSLGAGHYPPPARTGLPPLPEQGPQALPWASSCTSSLSFVVSRMVLPSQIPADLGRIEFKWP